MYIRRMYAAATAADDDAAGASAAAAAAECCAGDGTCPNAADDGENGKTNALK